MHSRDAVHIHGNDGQGGAYVLVLSVPQAVQISVYKRPIEINFPAGTYIYIGSAQAQVPTKSAALGKRLWRYTEPVRRGAHHAIRRDLVATLLAHSLGPADPARLQMRGRKRLHWAVDYVLDNPGVELTAIHAVRSPVRYETLLGRHLANHPLTSIVRQGMGASDVPGNTHLLGVQNPTRLQRHLEALFSGLVSVSPLSDPQAAAVADLGSAVLQLDGRSSDAYDRGRTYLSRYRSAVRFGRAAAGAHFRADPGSPSRVRMGELAAEDQVTWEDVLASARFAAAVEEIVRNCGYPGLNVALWTSPHSVLALSRRKPERQRAFVAATHLAAGVTA